jgi:hypothetical protein
VVVFLVGFKMYQCTALQSIIAEKRNNRRTKGKKVVKECEWNRSLAHNHMHGMSSLSVLRDRWGVVVRGEAFALIGRGVAEAPSAALPVSISVRYLLAARKVG